MPNVSQGMAAMIMFCSALVRLSALILMHLRKSGRLSVPTLRGSDSSNTVIAAAMACSMSSP